jgi:hypothetical protein
MNRLQQLAKAPVKQEFWISIFVIAYCTIVFIWCGAKWLGLEGFKDKITPLVTVFGFNQNWSLFSPDIRPINLHSLAIISFADGSLKLYEWPRMDKSDIFTKTVKEKYRKMLNDCLPWEEYRALWPAQANFVCRANFNPTNPPESLLLSYFWTSVPPAKLWFGRSTIQEHDKQKNYFVYQVQPEDIVLENKRGY